jgi:2-polyprenyl-6-methoxyphenol hydroxylase-like FAD-dependent oxidoreductase
LPRYHFAASITAPKPGFSMAALSRRRGRRAIIVGGSMSGLFTAAFLRQIGWECDVFERSSVELVGRGAGITTHPELLAALEHSGAGTQDLGIEVPKRITIDRNGRVIGERPLRQVLTSWDRLQRLLRATIDPARYHLGHTFERVEQDERGVRVHFAEGRIEQADLLIGGDGIRSGVRAQVAPDVQPIYSGYYIWRGAPNEADLSPHTLASVFPYFVFFLPERQQVIGYPISGFNNDLRPGHRRYNFIWYRVGDAQELRAMCVDENGHQHDHSVPPPLIRRDLIAQMRADAERIMPAAFLDCLRHIEQPFFTPIYDFSAPRIVFGRIALVGDAASSSRPHMGFGVAKAGGDAQALAQALDAHDDVDAALAAYDAERQPIGERIMLHGRKLGTHLGVDLRTDEDRKMWKLLQDFEAMMDWIAVPNFLAADR